MKVFVVHGRNFASYAVQKKPQADLNIRWAQIAKDTFPDVSAHVV